MERVISSIVECKNKTMWINRNGEAHRENGPAIIYNNGQHLWCKGGVKHRTDGPAVYYPNLNEDELGSAWEWYINGKELNEEDVNTLKKEILANFLREKTNHYPE